MRLCGLGRLLTAGWFFGVLACGSSTSGGLGGAGSSQGAQGGSLTAGNSGSAGASGALGGGGNAGTAGSGGSSGGSSGNSGAAGSSGSATTAGAAGSSGSSGADAAGSSGSAGSGGSSGASGGQGGEGGGQDTLTSNRQRLWQSYYVFLKANATQPQSNGLSSSNVSSACDAWSQLDPSSQAVFLTITARLQGSILGADGSSVLLHIVKLYRVTGGQLATATDPGSCGGGEYNLMMLSMDAELHDAQVAASSHQGALQPSGKYDIADAPQGTFWRDSHDLGGAHAPFDASDETDTGAPRGQTQYFLDPTSAPANAALGRMDLTTLVDPYALELDQDYDCAHNSNPLCSYTTYGPMCFPESTAVGTDLNVKTYGSIDPAWTPVCN